MTYIKFLLTRYFLVLAFLIIFTGAAFFLKDVLFTAIVFTVWIVYMGGTWQDYKKCRDNGYF